MHFDPFRWFRREARSAPPGGGLGAGYVPAAPNLSGTYVTPSTALGLTSVYAAINVISRDLATLPLNVYRKLPGGGRRIDEGHPLQELLNVAPNDELDSFRYRQSIYSHVLGWGNSYSEILRDKATGEVLELHPLDPAKTIPKRTDSGVLFYELANRKKLPAEDCLHLAGLGYDGLKGHSPVTVARQSIGLAVAVEQFGASFFGNGAVSKGILKLAKKLRPEALSNLRGSFNQVHQGSQSSHQLMLLEEGMDYIPTSIAPDDAQFLATRQFQVIEVARLYNLPPHKLGDYSESHLANVEEANLDYLSMTLVGWASMGEAQLNLKLLTRRDRKKYVIAHDFSALLRGNMAARGSFYQIMRNTGAFSTNDILSFEGMNPIPKEDGGDLRVIQQQYVDLGKVARGEPIAPPAPEPGPATEPDADDEKDKPDG